MRPFIAKFNVPAKRDDISFMYDVTVEMNHFTDGSWVVNDQRSIGVFTGSSMTKAEGDPTLDESSDR